MSGLKLEVGKFYRTRVGHKAGPVTRENWSSGWPFNVPQQEVSYNEFGSHRSDGIESSLDLIAEWTDAPTGPVRTVTRSEIVPGIYNRLGVGHQCGDHIWVGLVENDGDYDLGSLLDAGQLRALAATATEIADALEAPTQ